MPPEFEIYGANAHPQEALEEESCGSSDGEGDDLISAIAKISISSSEPYSAVNDIPSKFLNSLGFVNYNHMGQVPWVPKDQVKQRPEFTEVTKVLGVDCEMVGVGVLQDSELGRVSLINEYGFCIFDTFAKPEQEVTGYRSGKSGIYPENLENAPSVTAVVQRVQMLVRGKILVGHSIHNDLEVLQIKEHPETRDTAVFFKSKLGKSGTPALKVLTKRFLNYEIQTGDHSSIQDAQATLKLYLDHRAEWEDELEKMRQTANLPSPSHLMSSPKPIKEIHIQPRENDLAVESRSVFVRENKIVGAYSTSGEYLDVQFRLLLEDFLRPLRFGVKTIRTKGHQRVQITKLFKGVHIMLKPGEKEVRKSGSILIPMVRNNLVDVDWDESKLFMNGSLLLISPDNFKSVKFAIIRNGPKNSSSNSNFKNVKLDVSFCNDGPSWVLDEINNNFIVMESPAFYEAYRHTLAYLQVMSLDTFPMKPYIVDAETAPSLPKIMCAEGRSKKLDFQVFVGNNHPKRFADPLNFDTWPTAADLKFDFSQYDAFKKALTQKLTIIQGPPGTGKTFIGVETIKFLLTNPWLLQSCPILVVAYTNCALDQTLEKVFKFITTAMCGGNASKAEHLIMRVGGGSKSDIIQPLTMKYKKEQYQNKLALARIIGWQSRVANQLNPSNIAVLIPGLLNFQKLPPQCLNTLVAAAGRVWTKWRNVQDSIQGNPIAWFGLEDMGLPSLSNLKKQSTPKYQGRGKKKQISFFFFEYPNLLQKLMEKHPNYITQNASGQMDRRLMDLTLSRNITGVSDGEFAVRWAFYLYLLRRTTIVVDNIMQQLAANKIKYELIKEYPSLAASQKSPLVLGMTTTGAVKYKGTVVKPLKPKIMFVEEAAHVLEAHVVASLTEHCEQMIMIGDHQQLRPMTADHEMTNKYHLDVSLMERLVRNGIAQKKQNWIQLKNQHRMRPEIARMVCPVIYRELYNDPSVEKYPNVTGCQKNLYFIDHKNFEAREKGSSSFHNSAEAEVVCSLVKYFVFSSKYRTSQITVISTYLAQKTLIEHKLNNIMQAAKKDRVLVSSVDGYQGEENDIIILSLVRSNDDGNIGFLKTDNRVCVSLSRARHGFFMIGNMSCLKASSDTWDTINNTLVEMDCIGDKLPLGKRIDPSQLYHCLHNSSNGICNEDIFTKCTHNVAVKCHIVDNKLEYPICGLKCKRVFYCGHQCRFLCHDSDMEKHKNYQCLEKCKRLCPVAKHSCPGKHRCFQNCLVHQGTGCQIQMRLDYGCGHGTQMVSCNKLSSTGKHKLAFCPKCIGKIAAVKAMKQKRKQIQNQAT